MGENELRRSCRSDANRVGERSRRSCCSLKVVKCCVLLFNSILLVSVPTLYSASSVARSKKPESDFARFNYSPKKGVSNDEKKKYWPYSRLGERDHANQDIFVSPSKQLCGILVAATSTWTHFSQRALLSLLSERNVTFPTVVNLSAAVAAILVVASVIGSVSAATENRWVGRFDFK